MIAGLTPASRIAIGEVELPPPGPKFMNRRSFFNSLAKTAAIVALAPQLAFRVKPMVGIIEPKTTKVVESYWHQTDRHSAEFQLAMGS